MSETISCSLFLSTSSFSLRNKCLVYCHLLAAHSGTKTYNILACMWEEPIIFHGHTTAHMSKDTRTHTSVLRVLIQWFKQTLIIGSLTCHWDSDAASSFKHPPVVYGVCRSVVHGGDAVLPVHAWRGTHPRGHLRRHAGHVCGHRRTVGTRTHLPGAYPARWDASIRSPAALTRHRVHGTAHAGTTGRVVGIRHPCVARLPGVTWKGHRRTDTVILACYTKTSDRVSFH